MRNSQSRVRHRKHAIAFMTSTVRTKQRSANNNTLEVQRIALTFTEYFYNIYIRFYLIAGSCRTELPQLLCGALAK